MLTMELPTDTRGYVISIRNVRREDALTLSYLVTRLGTDMLGAQAGRRIGREGYTVCWSMARQPDFDAPPDMIVTDMLPPRYGGRAAVMALGGPSGPDVARAPAGTALTVRGERDCARVYTLGGAPYGTAEYIASLCSCPAAYVALGALCRAMGFVPVQLVQRLLAATVGRTEPHMLSNCEAGAFSGYRQVGVSGCGKRGGCR